MASSEREVIAALLQQLESEERALSRRRQKLHARIATFTDTTGSWEREEKEISRKRRALHRQIDALLNRSEKAPSGTSSGNGTEPGVETGVESSVESSTERSSSDLTS